MTLAVRRVRTVTHLFHPTKPRRYTFVDLGATVRVTRCTPFPGDRRQEELPRDRARNRWLFLRRLGYKKWEELR